MPDLTKEEVGKNAAQHTRKAGRGPGRPKKVDEVTPKNLVGIEKRKPGRPKGSGKRGPGRPKGSGKQGPGRPKGKPGRPKGAKGSGSKVSLKGYVKQREAKRMVKEAMKAFKNKLPKLITRELKRLLK